MREDLHTSERKILAPGVSVKITPTIYESFRIICDEFKFRKVEICVGVNSITITGQDFIKLITMDFKDDE